MNILMYIICMLLHEIIMLCCFYVKPVKLALKNKLVFR